MADNNEFEDGMPELTEEDKLRRNVVRIAGPVAKGFTRVVSMGGFEMESTQYEGGGEFKITAVGDPDNPGPNRAGDMFTVIAVADTGKPNRNGDIIPGLADKMNEFLRGKMREDRFHKQIRHIVPIPNDALDRSVPHPDCPQLVHSFNSPTEVAEFTDELAKHGLTVTKPEELLCNNSLTETTTYVPRESFNVEFFAYETIGATIPHTAPMYRTEDPELMEAIQRAENEGMIAIDDHGNVEITEKGKQQPVEITPLPESADESFKQFIATRDAYDKAVMDMVRKAELPDEDEGDTPHVVDGAK